MSIACAPEPTTPATTDLAGSWTSTARIATLSGFTLSLIQEPKGIVSGGWTAKGETGEPGCVPNVPCTKTGRVIGRSTVAQLELLLITGGRFDGVFIEPKTLRGMFNTSGGADTITFVRTGR